MAMNRHFAGILAVAAILAGCGHDDISAPQLTATAPSRADSREGSAGVVASARGHADIRYEFEADVHDAYSFAAIVRGDGSVSGQFEYRTRYRGLSVRVHGRVVCAVVAGNRARVGGVVTRSTFPEAMPPGHELTWSVTDNGEGKGSPDTASPLLGADAEAFCASGQPYLLESPQERGNIQVEAR